MLRQLASGAALFGRGFVFWRVRPRLMLVGLAPALVACIIVILVLVAWGASLPWLVDTATPFADAWTPALRIILRIAIGIVAFAAVAILAVVTFTALTLTIGDSAYERIALSVDEHVGGQRPEAGGSVWRTILDGILMVLLGLLIALGTFVVGFLPVIGGVVATVLGFVFTARLLAREIASRSLEAHGVPLAQRRGMLKQYRWQLIGFGILAQLCFLVPLGAIAVMPSAVAGGTLLARRMMGYPEWAGDPPNA